MIVQRSIIATACFVSLLLASAASAQVAVDGYTRKDGTYVQPYQRTAPNSTRNDNYSTQGNVNPYTGVAGTKPRDYQTPAYEAPKPYVNPYATAPTTPVYGQKPTKNQFGF
jgi:hypothetical protein